jgi:hypothetical protein
MIETTTYFEAYRPVLNALQIMPSDHGFPLSPFILKLTNKMIPPDYIKSTTTYDFTPLLVDPNSSIQTNFILHETFRINYKQSNQISKKYKKISVLNKDEWPTSEQLHLNPKQREALILALTNKVALIQGRKSNYFKKINFFLCLISTRNWKDFSWCTYNRNAFI